MNYGRFFRLNIEKSDLSHGIAFYDYIWIEDKDCNKNGTPKFPFFLTISNDSIDFHAHFLNYYDDQDRKYLKHQNNTILTLPLSENLDVKDGLTGSLINGWETNFPKYDDGESNYLHEKVKEAIKSYSDDKNISLCYAELQIFNDKPHKKSIFDKAKEIRNHFKNKAEDDKKYYSLKKIKNILFNKPNKESIFAEEKEKIKKIEREGGIVNYSSNKFIRILILDFLYDLEHTKVFQTSPHYEHISMKLKENFFFNALANKAKYYYYRENESNQKRKSFFLENYLLPAEEQWIKSIMDLRSDHYFTIDEGKWFDNPEEEMKKIYSKYKSGIVIDHTDANASFEMPSGNVSLKAVFKRLPDNLYSIAIPIEGDGTAHALFDGINANKANTGDLIQLRAIAHAGSHFDGWKVSGGITFNFNDANASFEMPSGNVSLKAVFKPLPKKLYSITISIESDDDSDAHALIDNIKTSEAESGKLVQLRAIAHAENYFDGWMVESGGITFNFKDAITSFEMPSGNVSLKAVFKPLPEKTYNIAISIEGNGSIKSLINGINANKAESDNLVQLRAIAHAGSYFDGWVVVSGGITFNLKDAITSFEMPSGNVSLKAVFKPLPEKPYSIAISKEGNGSTQSLICGKIVKKAKSGDLVQLRAIPCKRSCFDCWVVVSEDPVNGITLCERVQNEETKPRVKKKAREVSKWQLGKFDFRNAGVSGIISMAGLFCLLSFIIMLLVRNCNMDFICNDSISSNFSIICLICLGVLFISLVFFISKNFKHLHYSFGIHLFFPRLLASIVLAWTTLSFSEGLFKIFHEISFFWGGVLVIIPLIIFILILVYSEIRKTVPYIKSKRKIFFRSLSLFSVAFSYSFLIGILATTIISGQYLKISINKGEDFSKISQAIYLFCNKKFVLFPDYLIVFTFVAMFIGIFLNLFLPDRKIIPKE